MALALVAVGAERDQVVVVEGDAVGTQLGQAVDRLHRVEGLPGGVAEGSQAGHPTVHRPKLNLSSRVGRGASIGQLLARHDSGEMVPAATPLRQGVAKNFVRARTIPNSSAA